MFTSSGNGTLPASRLDHVIGQLCSPEAMRDIAHSPLHNAPMPSLECVREIVYILKTILFPGYFGTPVLSESHYYHIAASIDSVLQRMSGQIYSGACFSHARYAKECGACTECQKLSYEKAVCFIERLPVLRRLLASDVRAAYEGDPAATSLGETIFCYPSILAMTHYRIAHELSELEVPLLPRILTEMAHASTGIDIHPGARIGEGFFIDHGTGVVIGETCVIGKNCRLYQGVTLGALSFRKDASGVLIKGLPRHPHLGDGVTIYAGATVLGNITIGSGAIIGANMWVTEDVPERARIISGNK